MGRKILDSIWFTSHGSSIGLVLMELDNGDKKIYMGTGDGLAQRTDEEYICENGARVHPAAVIEFLEKGLPDPG